MADKIETDNLMDDETYKKFKKLGRGSWGRIFLCGRQCIMLL